MKKFFKIICILFGIVLAILSTLLYQIFRYQIFKVTGSLAVFFILFGFLQNIIYPLFQNNKILSYLYNLFIIAVSFVLISCLVIIPVIYAYSKTTPKNDYNAVVILGAGLIGDRLSFTLMSRLNKGIEYYNKNPNSVVLVTGGQGEDELVTEASAMKKYLIQQGIPENKILTEDKSTSTKENFLFSKKILDEHFKNEEYSILFVSNEFHLLRSKLYANDAGFTSEGVACRTKEYLFPYYYFREYLAIMYYLVIESILKIF